MIEVDGLTFRYPGAARDALRDVRLRVEPGELVVLHGPTGCGKSTLALAMAGFLLHRHAGEVAGGVLVDGVDVRQRPIFETADVVGLVQQNPEAQFCTLTVRDEVAFGLENRRVARDRIREQVDWALGVVGARGLAGRALATLSGGEQQKISVAAMLAAEPRVLILDEPTAHLDPTATAELFAVIARIRERTSLATVVIEHELGFLAPFAPRYVGLDRGAVVSDAREPPESDDGDPPPPLPAPDRDAAPLAEADGLTVRRDGAVVLDAASLRIHAGEIVAVMGDNGSGKTTLLRCLLGLQRPDGGRLTVLGHDGASVPVSTLARGAGLVFQNPDHQLFADTVGDEARLGPRAMGLLDGDAERRIADLLGRCGLDGRQGEHPHRLSVGQKRRLTLASALAHGPSLVLLDEVLVGQDPAAARFVMGLLHEVARAGAAVVLATHDPATTARYASRVVFLERGRVAIDAPVDAAFAALGDRGLTHYLPPGAGDAR